MVVPVASRRAVFALLWGSLLAGCETVSDEEAARADSSAAGYQVGVRAGGDTGAATLAATTGDTSMVARRAEGTPARRDTARAVAASRAAAIPDTGRRTAGTSRTAATAASRRDSTRVAEVARARARVDSVRRDSVRRDSVRRAQTPPRPTGPVRVNDFLTYDASAKTVSIRLIAGYTGANGSLNFNGGARGAQGVSVPLGWRVHVSLSNRSQELQHSAIVVREILPPPLELPPPAFEGAAIEKVENGIRDDETASFEFVPTQRGRYMLGCGVVGHAEGGMWLRLTVVGSSALPLYR